MKEFIQKFFGALKIRLFPREDLNKIMKLKRDETVPENFTGLVEYPNGHKEWLRNGKKHKVGAPAVISSIGTKYWFQNDLCHRLDGPAVEWTDGSKRYYVFDQWLTKEEFEIFRFLWENTFLEQTDKLMKIFVELVLVDIKKLGSEQKKKIRK